MSERIEQFSIDGTPTIQVKVASGSIRFIDGEAGEVVVKLEGKDSAIERYRIEQSADLVQVELESGRHFNSGRVRITVTTGTAPEVRAKVSSGDLVAPGELADLQVDTASGDVRVDRVAGDVAARSASGDIRLGSVDGHVKASLASGDVQIGVAKGGGDFKTASGDVKVKIAEGGIKAKSASGDLQIGNLRAGDLDVKSLSGDVVVGIPAGRTLEVNLDAVSGKVSTDFPVQKGGGDHAGHDDGGVSVIRIKTVSGDVTLRPAS
jgi:DUF4097 and DUF4098 domain-containing protein YvlB